MPREPQADCPTEALYGLARRAPVTMMAPLADRPDRRPPVPEQPMPRFSEPAPDAMTADQRRAYDAIVSGPRGAVKGPLKVWIQRPELAEKAQQLGAYCRFGSSLPPRLSELAIIITGRFWQAEYEWYSHAPTAAEAGISEAAIQSIRLGRRPEFDRSDEQAVHEFVTELNTHHRVSDATYKRAVAELGLDGVVDLVGIAGYYTLISMTIRAFEVALPDGVKPAFADADA